MACQSTSRAGRDHAALRDAYPEARFLGRASDEELVELYAGARAVVVASREEFGITAVEAQAAGRPVIAAAAGGALETVLDGRTGRLVNLTTIEELVKAIKEIDTLDFEPAAAVSNAEALLGRGVSAQALGPRAEMLGRNALEGSLQT